jgi:hypothetical protein
MRPPRAGLWRARGLAGRGARRRCPALGECGGPLFPPPVFFFPVRRRRPPAATRVLLLPLLHLFRSGNASTTASSCSGIYGSHIWGIDCSGSRLGGSGSDWPSPTMLSLPPAIATISSLSYAGIKFAQWIYQVLPSSELSNLLPLPLLLYIPFLLYLNA